MKLMGLKAELVTEFAKELVYSENHTDLNNQLLILAEQDRRMRRLVGEVDYIITDSPLLLTTVYNREGTYEGEWFTEAARALHRSYVNANFFILREKPYQQYGRSQTEDEAREYDLIIDQALRAVGRGTKYVPGNEKAPDAILGHLGLLH